MLVPLLVILLGVATPVTSAPFPGMTAAQVEAEIVELTNQERVKLELNPLRSLEPLANCARAHSFEMMDLDYFDHDSPTASLREPWLRVREAGLRHDAVGENIFSCEGYDLRAVATLTVSSWMSSPDHRANIVRNNFFCVGVGLCVRGREVMITQDFTGPQG